METEKIVTLPKIEDYRGNLSFIEEFSQVPFKILRTYWLNGLNCTEITRGHAFKKQGVFIVVLSGSIDIEVHSGQSVNNHTLNQPNIGLYIPPNLWRKMINISKNSLILIVCSTIYDKDDLILDYLEFKELISDRK